MRRRVRVVLYVEVRERTMRSYTANIHPEGLAVEAAVAALVRNGHRLDDDVNGCRIESIRADEVQAT